MWGFVKGDIMTYIEKEISYADYVRLRESVNWNNFFKEQTEKCLKNTLNSIEVIDDNTIIGMGRLIGDGMYYRWSILLLNRVIKVKVSEAILLIN